MSCESRKCQFLVWRWVLLKKVIPKHFRWCASVIQAKYKRVLSEKGGGVFALSTMNYANPTISGPGSGYHAGDQKQRCFPLQGKKLNSFLMQSLPQRNIFFLFHRYSWLTMWLKTSNLSLEGRGLFKIFIYFPLSAEKKTQNGLMTGHSFEIFVHSKQSKAKRELLPRLTFQK